MVVHLLNMQSKWPIPLAVSHPDLPLLPNEHEGCAFINHAIEVVRTFGCIAPDHLLEVLAILPGVANSIHWLGRVAIVDTFSYRNKSMNDFAGAFMWIFPEIRRFAFRNIRYSV